MAHCNFWAYATFALITLAMNNPPPLTTKYHHLIGPSFSEVPQVTLKCIRQVVELLRTLAQQWPSGTSSWTILSSPQHHAMRTRGLMLPIPGQQWPCTGPIPHHAGMPMSSLRSICQSQSRFAMHSVEVNKLELAKH